MFDQYGIAFIQLTWKWIMKVFSRISCFRNLKFQNFQLTSKFIYLLLPSISRVIPYIEEFGGTLAAKCHMIPTQSNIGRDLFLWSNLSSCSMMYESFKRLPIGKETRLHYCFTLFLIFYKIYSALILFISIDVSVQNTNLYNRGI